MLRRLTLLLVVLAATVLMDGGSGEARDRAYPSGPSEATASANGKRVRAVADSHCVTKRHSRGGAYCRETKGLEDDGPSLRVAKGDVIRIRLGARATRLRASIGRPDPDSPGRDRDVTALPVSRISDSERRWKLKLSRSIPTRRALRLEPRYRVYKSDIRFSVWLEPRGD